MVSFVLDVIFSNLVFKFTASLCFSCVSMAASFMLTDQMTRREFFNLWESYVHVYVESPHGEISHLLEV